MDEISAVSPKAGSSRLRRFPIDGHIGLVKGERRAGRSSPAPIDLVSIDRIGFARVRGGGSPIRGSSGAWQFRQEFETVFYPAFPPGQECDACCRLAHGESDVTGGHMNASRRIVALIVAAVLTDRSLDGRRPRIPISSWS